MSQHKDIIINSVVRWDQAMAGSSLAIAKELSKTHRVFFVDRAFSIKDLFDDYENFSLRKRLKAILFRVNPFLEIQTGFSNFVVATPGLTLPINFLPAGIIFDFFNSYNNLIVKLCIKRMVKQYDIKEYIYFNYFNPVILPTLKLSSAKKLMNIYYVTHDIRLSKYMSKHGDRAEKKLLSKTDLVLVSSKHQFKRLFNQNINMHYFPNAVDYRFFENIRNKNITKPYDLINIGDTKVILFCGYLSEIRIDYKLLKIVCENFPQNLVVIVGKYEEQDLIKHKLDTFHNLIILGNRRFESIPTYIKCASVTIIPYLCNELNKSVYPLKLNEYLAMGKPVVTTHFSEDLESFSDVVYIASTYDLFLSYLEQAMTQDTEDKMLARLKVASTNSWGNRVSHLEGIIHNFLEKNSQ
jgi:teichuronic acid biosynthesis glycosyltransferase TuaH